MAIARIDVARFPVPFRRPFSHSSATRKVADNVIVRAVSDKGAEGFGEGCPRDYVTGETTETARQFLRSIAGDAAGAVVDVEQLRGWSRRRKEDIDRNPAAFTALEMAVLDMMARERGISLESLLGLPPLSPSHHRYTAVIGDTSTAVSWAIWSRYRIAGLRDFKVKISSDADRDRARLAPFRAFGGQRLRLDANNLWREPRECMAYLARIGAPVFAIEEPLGAGDLSGCRAIAGTTGLSIVLDESFLSETALESLPRDVDWIANVRISKLGGILRTLEIVETARRHGLKIVVGAHVGETGLLSRAALPVARAAGEALLAQEGAFGTYLLTRDLTEPSPRFGARGFIPAARLPESGEPGLGLRVDPSRLEAMETIVS